MILKSEQPTRTWPWQHRLIAQFVGTLVLAARPALADEPFTQEAKHAWQVEGSPSWYPTNARPAWSDSGHSLFVASGAHAVLVELNENRERLRLVCDSSITALAASSDGHLLATSTVKGTISIYRRSGAFAELQTLVSHVGGFITGLGFSEQGQLVTLGRHAAAGPAQVQILDVSNGQPLKSFDLKTTIGSTHMAGGRWVMMNEVVPDTGLPPFNVAHPDRLYLLDVRSGRTSAPISWSRTPVADLCLTANGNRALVNTSYNGAYLWTVGRSPDATKFADLGTMTSCDFSADGQFLATAHTKGELRIWNTETKRPTATVRVANTFPTSVSLSPDSQRVAVSYQEGLPRVWKTSEPRTIELSASERCVARKTVVSAGAETAAIVCADRSVQVWRWNTNPPSLVSWPASSAHTVALSRNGERLLMANDNRGILFNLKQGRTEAALSGQAIRALSLGPRQDTYAVADGDEINMYRFPKGDLMARFSPGSWTSWLAFTRDGETLMAGGADELTLWEPSSRAPLGRDHSFNPTVATLSGDEKFWVAAASEGRWVAIDRATREVRWLGAKGAPITAIGTSVDGKQVVTGTRDGVVSVWDLATGARQHNFTGDGGSANGVTIIGKANYAIAGTAHQVFVWSLKTGQQVLNAAVAQGLNAGYLMNETGRVTLFGNHVIAQSLLSCRDKTIVVPFDVCSKQVETESSHVPFTYERGVR